MKKPSAQVTLTADVILFRQGNEGQGLEILLIQRRKPPFQGMWAFPGGKVDCGESAIQAAHRELEEETGITEVHLLEHRTMSAPTRDPRGHYVSVCYWGAVPTNTIAHAGDDAQTANWFPLSYLPFLPFAFDHHTIIADIMRNAPLLKLLQQETAKLVR